MMPERESHSSLTIRQEFCPNLLQSQSEPPKIVPVGTKREENILEGDRDKGTLTFQLPNKKAVVFPKKRFYVIEDIAIAIGKDNIENVQTRVYLERRNDPTINSQRARVGIHNRHLKLIFGEEDFKKIVISLVVKKRLIERPESLIIPSNGTRLGGLTEKEKAILELFFQKHKEGKGLSREEAKQAYVAAGGNPNIGNRQVRNMIQILGQKLWETCHSIKSTNQGQKSIYIMSTDVP